jgi:hypothetical protein
MTRMRGAKREERQEKKLESSIGNLLYWGEGGVNETTHKGNCCFPRHLAWFL